MAKSLRNLWLAVRTTPPVLLGIVGFCIIYLALKISRFDAMPELFTHAMEFGKVFQDLTIATIAAFIFFVFSVQLPQVYEQQSVSPAIYSLADRVVGNIVGVLVKIRCSANGLQRADFDLGNVNEQFVRDLFEAAAPEGSLDPDVAKDWIKTLIHENNKCRHLIREIWTFVRFLDAEVAARLTNIEYSQYSRTLILLEKGLESLANPNLSNLAEPFFASYCEARKLSESAMRVRGRFGMSEAFGI